MAEQGSQDKGEGKRPSRALFPGLGMNEIAASQTAEASEVPKRVRWLWLLLIAIMVGVAALGYGMRQMLNVAPGTEAQQKLQTRLQTLSAWRSGAVLGAKYTAGDRLRVDFSPAMPSDPTSLRKVTIEVMKEFMQERRNRDLFIDGFLGEKQVVWGEYRDKGKLQVAEGDLEPNIAVKVAGEHDEGMSGMVRTGPRGQ